MIEDTSRRCFSVVVRVEGRGYIVGWILSSPYKQLECSDSFTILGLWFLGLTVSHINESNCKLMSPDHYFS